MRREEKEGRTYCLKCGKKLSGRTDKVFCSDRCRSLYNYHKSRSRTLARARVLGMLERNYMLLDALIAQGVTEIPVADLVAMGFKADNATSITFRGKMRDLWCYDIRYNITSGRLHNLRRPLDMLQSLP